MSSDMDRNSKGNHSTLPSGLQDYASRSKKVRELVTSATRDLALAGVEVPRLAAEILLAHVLHWARIRVISHDQDSLVQSDVEEYLSLVRRRVEGEPLQYITGEQEFYGRAFHVNRDVLIPRPETELLVEKAVDLAANWWKRETCFVDVGTGSGCIAVSVSCELERSRGWAVDISMGALRIARSNANRHAVGQRISFIEGDLLNSFLLRPTFDLVLCNPPYIARTDVGALPAIVRDYEPPLALLGGDLGLEVVIRLIQQAASRLSSTGYLLMEIGAGQCPEVTRIIEREGLCLIQVVQDLQGIQRCIVASQS